MSASLQKPTLLRVALLLLFCLSVAAAFSQTVHLPGSTPVGSNAVPQMIALTLPQAGTVAAVQVLTLGVPGRDFQSAASTCGVGQSYLAGQQCSVTVAFHPLAPGERRGAVVLLSSANKPLAMQFVAATATGPVSTFLPGSILTVAGNEAWIYGGDGNLAVASSIFLPFGVAVNPAGDLLIADSSNNRIRRVDGASGIISTIAGNGVIGNGGDGGPATAASLSSPSSIALDAAGDVYFADSGNNLIRRIDAFTGLISTVAGVPGTHGYAGDLGPATAATLNTPNGIAFDTAGNLYIADTGNHVVRQVSPAGTISTIAGRGFASFSGDGGPAVSAGLSSPWSVTPIPTGGLYIADQNNHRIRRIDGTGTISTVAGTGVAAYSGDGGPAALAELNVPASVALDVAGNLYIADSGNNRVRKIGAHTGLIYTIAGDSGESISGDGGPADTAGLYGPYTLALDDAGALLVADVFHNRIRRIAANAATLFYQPMRAGRISAPMLQALENDGNAPLNFTSLAPITQAQLDPNATTCLLTTALAPLDQCVLSIQFTPTQVGNPIQGIFDAKSDAVNSPGVVDLVGQVLDVDPSTVTVTSSANPSTTGAAVTFSVAVSSAGATPSGQVTLLDGTTPLATAQLAAGGLASFTVATLSSGQHSITVSYAGDASNSAAVSTVLLQVIKDLQAATTTLLSSSASPAVAGATLRLNASIAVTTQGSGSGTVSGVVSFQEGLNTLGTADVVNSSATLSITTLAPGTHTIVASYGGNATYAGSSSTALTQVVQVAQTKLALSTSANPANAGAALGLTATILSTGGTPTGAVTFLDGGKAVGTANLNGQGVASLQVAGPAWTPGTHTLTASYAGDTYNATSVSPPISETVALATTTNTLTASANPSPLGGPVTLTATLASNGGTPTGTVQFMDGSTSLGAGTLNAQGAATLTTSALALGNHKLSAVYAGDPYDAASTSAAVAESITTTSVAVTISPSNDPAVFATPVVFTLQVTANGAVPTGSIVLNEGAATLAQGKLDASGKATFTLSNLPIGAHSLAAMYAGDGTHMATTSPVLVERILQSTGIVLTASPAQAAGGTTVTLTATLTGANARPTTGPIVLSDGATILATLVPSAAGVVTYSSTTFAVGAHTITASYAGDDTNAATSTSTSLTVTIASTATTLTSSVNPANAGSPLTLAASVAGTGGTLTGSITFADAGTPIGAVSLTGTGAALTLSTLAPGIHQLTAIYSGDAYNALSTSPALVQQVARATTITLASSANPSLLTDSVTLTLTAANGTPAPPTGVLTLTDGAAVLAKLPLQNGTASYTMTSPALGIHTLQAVYAGDPQNAPAASQPLIQSVTLRPSTTTFTPSSTALANGQQLILISVVQPPGQTTGQPQPSGSVTFRSGSQTLGTAPIAAGIATLTLVPSAGLYTVSAVYSGDGLYATSASAVTNIIVEPPVAFTLTATPPNLSLKSGDHTSFTVALATNPVFADTLAFGCAGLPVYATCTFSENQVAVGGGLPHTLTVTLDTGNPLGAGPTASLAQPRGTIAFCIFPAMLFLALFHPRKRKVLQMGSPFHRRPFIWLVALGAAATLAALTGCGTSFTQQATAPGAYTFQVVATGNHTGSTETTTLQLKVTQ